MRVRPVTQLRRGADRQPIAGKDINGHLNGHLALTNGGSKILQPRPQTFAVIERWSMATLTTAAIAPLVIVGIFLERYIVSGLTAGAGR
jgi:hypothetical protein